MTQASNAESIVGTSSVRILLPITTIQAQEMGFGTIILNDDQGGIITLGTDGTLSLSNTLNNHVGTARTARFTTSGTPNTNLTISFQNGVLTGDGTPIVISNLIHNAGNNPAFDQAGLLTFDVGGQLMVNENQASGIYTGSYNLVINYQ